MKKTLVINLFSGPGAGKSSLCSTIFSWLKWRDVDCEVAWEYAKDTVWDGATNLLNNQISVFGEQHRRLFRLIGKVDVAITDCPLPLSVIYDHGKTQYLKELVMSEFNKCINSNYFLVRQKKYNPNGRLQTEAKAIEKDTEIKDFLEREQIPYSSIISTEKEAEEIGEDVLYWLQKYSSS